MIHPSNVRVRMGSLLLVSALLATACGGSDDASTDDGPTETVTSTDGGGGGNALQWESCDDYDIAVERVVLRAAEQAGMECATLAVPVDYSDPDGETIDLALGRIEASRSKSRVGSIVTNPGGPGGSGLEFLASAASILPAELTKQFDIVSFDPRGLASSSPLDCLSSDERKEWLETDADEDATEALVQQFEAELVGGCAAANEALFDNIGTNSVVDDLDRIREALGEETLNFLGMSYGTRIGAAYATRYPDRVRAIVLDSPVTPDLELGAMLAGQRTSIAETFTSFYTWCNSDPDCALGPDAEATIRSVRATLDATPITVSTDNGDETLDGDLFETAVITAMYDPTYSEPLVEAVSSLDPGNPRQEVAATFLVDLAGMQYSRQPDGSYGNGFDIQQLVNCADASGPLTLERSEELSASLPSLLDDAVATATSSCTIIPTGDTLELGPTDAADRVLLIGTVGDPATPYGWMEQLADALGSSLRLTYEGSGHAVSLTRACVSDQLVDFFVDPSGFSPVDCAADPEERNIFALVAAQFETMGLPAETSACIAEGLSSTISPLDIAADDGSDPASDLLAEVSRIALQCR